LTDGRIAAGLDGSGNVNSGKVNTPAIVDNAVTGSVAAHTAGATLVSEGAWTVMQSVTLTVTGKPVLLLCTLSHYTPSTVGYFYFRLKRGGTVVWASAKGYSTNGYINISNMSFTDVPSAGTYT